MAFEWLERAATQQHGAAARALSALYRSLLTDDAPAGEPALAAARVIADAVRYWSRHAGLSDDATHAAAPAWAASADPPPDGTWPALRARLQTLAEAGNAAAAHSLGDLLWRTPTSESPEVWLTRAAEGGHVEAMHGLGRWSVEQFDEEHFSELLDRPR
jgi:TPR repeat protein